jgi:hypothetical protein
MERGEIRPFFTKITRSLFKQLALLICQTLGKISNKAWTMPQKKRYYSKQPL